MDPIYPPQHRHPHSEIPEGPLVRVFSQAKNDFYLTALDNGEVIMAPANVSDPHQIWIKDESWGQNLKDAAGFRAFALINRGTGKALRHGTSENELIYTVPYHKGHVDDSILWSTSDDLGHGFTTIRMYNNTDLNMDADHGDKKHGGIKEGTKLILYHWLKEHDNQRWKMVPV